MSIHQGPWAEGTPSWVDLAVDDLDASIAFYSELFGWDCVVGPPETGRYTMCMLDGQVAAGIGTKPETMAGMPSVWTTYLAVDDADATAAKVTAAGGSAMAEPFDVMTFGRMAICLDTNSAAFGIWQSYDMPGATVVNQPGAFTWNENMSGDWEAAKAFYTSVFGYEIQDMSGGGFSYAGLLVDGRPVAGVGEPGTESPAAWTTYFSTADTDAAIKQVAALGGTLVSPASDTPFGRMACLTGPEGEVFSVIQADDSGQ